MPITPRSYALLFGLGVLFAIPAALVACTGGLPHPSASDAQRLDPTLQQIPLSKLEWGRERYLARCGNCHTLFNPADLPPQRWQPVVEEMRVKRGAKLKPDEEQAIVHYLVAISMRQHT